MLKIPRSSSEFSFFASKTTNDKETEPLLSFRTTEDYPWLGDVWRHMKPIERINALIYSTDEKGRTLLVKAVRHCEYALIHTLLKNPEMAVNESDVYGNTALHHAAIMKDNQSLEILLTSSRVVACAMNRDNRTACDLLLTDYASFNEDIRECCLARVLMDQAILQYQSTHAVKVGLALEDLSLLKSLQETIRQRYHTAWMLSEYRNRHFPTLFIPLDLQNEIILHHFTL